MEPAKSNEEVITLFKFTFIFIKPSHIYLNEIKERGDWL